MILAGRSNSFVRSALVISRCSRYPADGCSGVLTRGVATWISGTRVSGNVIVTSPGTRHESGGRQTDTNVIKKQRLEGNDKTAVKERDHVETEDRRVGRNGLARGEPNSLSGPDSPETVTPSHAVEGGNTDGVQGKKNWLEYQARLQAKAGLVVPEEATRGPGGSGGGGGSGTSNRRARRKVARGSSPTQQTPHAQGLEATYHTIKSHETASISGKHNGYQSREGKRGSHSNHRVDVKDDSAALEDLRDGGEPHVSGHDSGRARAMPPVPADGRDDDSEVVTDESRQQSHFEQPGSAWQNLHVKANLMSLMKGLAGDYGVIEGLKERSIVKRTMSKVLPVFSSLVLENPDVAFPGEGGQRTQRAITKLCYDPGFRPDAVIRRRPFKVLGGSGRAFHLNAGGGRGGGTFASARAKLVQEVFIPRIVELARERFPHEVESARIMLEAADLSNPHAWYPLARLRKRRIIYHGGPTNSGKTYNAISRLKQAGATRKPGEGPAGIFCGPLRLLALEVYEQLNSQGVYCSLNTGQEKREVPFATHVSCTIEMASTSNDYEVAVIDEIQMIADGQRGQIWTAALLGLNCPEIHVCGGLEAAKLVEALAAEMGDEFELRQYERKTALVCADESLKGNYANVQPGDAVVAFSRKDIFSIKREIESKTPFKCCIVYGTLPQETRADQARLFNTEGTGYDVLVASDAIGMGLNLNIRRVVFHSVNKRTPRGRGFTPLPPTLLKQIGGRAGRHGKQWDFGEVTCLKDEDMSYMRQVMETPLEPIAKARIFPIAQRVQTFANCLELVGPETVGRRRLADILELFAGEAKVGHRFILGEHQHQQKIADAMHAIENLTLEERFTICMAPVNQRNEELVRAITLFAEAHANRLPAFVNMHLPAEGVLPRSVDEFEGICAKHAVLEVYKWMANRFPSLECTSELTLAERQKEELVAIIQRALREEDIRVSGKSSVGLSLHDDYDASVLDEIAYPF